MDSKVGCVGAHPL